MTEEDNAPELAADRPAPEWTPMPDFTPERKEKIFSGEREGLAAAGEELAKAREDRRAPKVADDAPITERHYHYEGGYGDKVPEHYTLDARRAGADLSNVRAMEVEAATPLQPVTQAIDETRAAWNEPQQPQQAEQQPQQAEQRVEQQQPQQQAQTDPTQDGIDPEIAEALSRPKVRAALEQTVAQAEQARAAYSQGSQQAAQLSAAAVLSQWPALASLSAQELPHALAAIAKVDPSQAAQIQNQLQRTQNLYQAHVQAEQAQQQVQAQRAQQWGAHEDLRFEQSIAAESPETRRSVLENGRRILQEHYGVDSKALAQAFQSSAAFRSAETQKMLFDLIKMKTAQESAATKLDRSVPPVSQRPGTSRPDNSDDSAVAAALNRFRADPSPKTGSVLLRARRNATRNR